MKDKQVVRQSRNLGAFGKNFSVRSLGALMVPLIFGESVLGILSAGSTIAGILVAHIVFGVGVIIVAGWSLFLVSRLQSTRIRILVLFTFLSIASAATTGAIFLATNFAQGALIDRIFALAALAGASLMIVFGSRRIPKRQSYDAETEHRK
jgi:hypothetical protein